MITGDMVDSYHTDIDIALRFAEEAMEIAPCYYVTGNHEARISEYDDLKAGLKSAGVVVLENESTCTACVILCLGKDPSDKNVWKCDLFDICCYCVIRSFQVYFYQTMYDKGKLC